MAKDTVVDPTTGFALTKGGHAIMKTSQALFAIPNMNPGSMAVELLEKLQTVIFEDGSASFDVKGFSKSDETGEVMLLVMGGTLTFDDTGLTDATGDAKLLLFHKFGGKLDAGDDGQRKLRSPGFPFPFHGRLLPPDREDGRTLPSSGPGNAEELPGFFSIQ